MLLTAWRISNSKFKKGAQIEANLGAVAREQLLKKDQESVWGSTSPFVNEEDLERHVKPLHRG
jgi:hypothetical protein